jgi:membrane-bound lytic murein transglycosylase MltF
MSKNSGGKAVRILPQSCAVSPWRGTVAVIGLVTLSLLSSCSKEKSPETAKTNATDATAPTAPAQSAETSVPVDAPKVLQTPWKGDLDGIVKRRVVRVLVPFRRPEFFYMDGHPVGILQEAFQELERTLNAKYKTGADNRIIVALLPTPADKLKERMVGGWGDVAAYGISITEQNKALVDFTVPTITGLKIIAVTGPGAPELKSVDALSGKDVWINPATRQKQDLESLNARLKSEGKAPVAIKEVDAVLEPADVMEMVNAGTYPIALMQSQEAQFWSQVFENAKPRPDLAVAEDVSLGWAIQKGTPQWKAFLDDFVTTHGAGTSFGNTVLRRYLKDVKYVKNARDPAELRKFDTTAPYFKKYAADYQFDYLLLVAQGYQESGLDQSVKSKVGAVGIMQVMPKTVASAPVKIPNVSTADANIHAGVRLLHYLVNDYFNEPDLDKMNRTLFAIAAYNAGPAKIARCRQVAKDMGYDPNQWFQNVEVATAKIVGRETTQYVANIYKYYIAYRMAAEMRSKRLGPRPPN